MKEPLRLVLFLTAGPALASIATAAAPLDVRGMVSAWAIGISTSDGGSISTPSGIVLDPLRLKPPLNQTTPSGVSTPPAPWAPMGANPSVLMPDFSSAALFGVHADVIEVDAHSTGSDQIPWPDLEGAPAVGGSANNWLIYVASATRGSHGTSGGHIYERDQAGAPVGAELVSYYPMGNTGLDASLAGITAVEATALSMGYDGTVAGTRDVDALDYSIGGHTFTTNPTRTSFVFPSYQTYYFSTTFSTTVNWSSPNPFAVDNRGTTPVDVPIPRPGDIYFMEWSAAGWGPIQLYRSCEELDLVPFVDDVDALAINPGNGVVIFSTVLNASRPMPQLQINTGTANSTMELTDVTPGPNGVHIPVESQLDLGGEFDDIDALCAIEPEAGLFDSMVGLATTSLANSQYFAPSTPMMGVSLERGVAMSGGISHLNLQVSGWGGGGPMNTQTQVWFYLGPHPLPIDGNPFKAFYPTPTSTVMFQPVWDVLGGFPRASTQGQWDLSLPFNAALSSPTQPLYLGICAVQNSSNGPGGTVLAGSLVTQIKL